ncbi:MAG: hypothetical protein M3Y87_18435, partial [Myxococcota bacterium]|nr:hypothetical protein [Myxococcota bacterium]
MPTRERSSCPVLPLLLVVTLAIGASTARADRRWADELPVLRAALTTYDLEGDATFAALEDLGRVADATGEGAREARALRALAAADLLVVSRSDERHAALEDRVAAVYGVSALELHAHLLGELESVRGGVYRRVVEDALQALALIDEVDVPIAIDWAHHTGARRDVLFLRAAATGALQAGAVLDPCADASVACPAPWSGWDAPTRARIT